MVVCSAVHSKRHETNNNVLKETGRDGTDGYFGGCAKNNRFAVLDRRGGRESTPQPIGVSSAARGFRVGQINRGEMREEAEI